MFIVSLTHMHVLAWVYSFKHYILHFSINGDQCSDSISQQRHKYLYRCVYTVKMISESNIVCFGNNVEAV